MTEKLSKKRINFYQLQATQKISDKEESLSKDDIQNCLNFIYDKLSTNSNNYKYKQFIVGFNQYIIEFINFNVIEKFIFARIGKHTNENTIGKRDSLTGDLFNIELQENESIESYTYLYLDLNNMILSYLLLSGTPSKTAFANFINGEIENVEFECVPIATNDVLKRLASKSVLGTINYSYCNPKENITKDIPGIDKELLSDLNTQKTVIAVSLRPPRSKSITKKVEDILKIKEYLMKEHESNLKSLNMNAKDEDEEAVNYNLLDYHFTTFTYISMLSLKTEKDFLEIIEHEYKKNKRILEDFTR